MGRIQASVVPVQPDGSQAISSSTMARARLAPLRGTVIAAVALSCAALLVPLAFTGGIRSSPAESQTPKQAVADAMSLIEDSTDTIVVGDLTLRAFPLVKTSTESVGLAASTVGAMVGYIVPVVGGVVLSSILAWLWMEASRRNISTQLNPDDVAYSVAKDFEDFAGAQGTTALEAWNSSAQWINRSF